MAPPPAADMRWLLFSASGRIGRRTYVMALAFWLAVLAIPVTMAVRVTDGGPAQPIVGLALVVTCLVAIVSILMIVIKRLHDVGMPGLAAFALVVPFLLVALPVLAFWPSTEGPNRNGARPDRRGHWRGRS